MVDASGSIGLENFEKVKQFIKQVDILISKIIVVVVAAAAFQTVFWCTCLHTVLVTWCTLHTKLSPVSLSVCFDLGGHVLSELETHFPCLLCCVVFLISSHFSLF